MSKPIVYRRPLTPQGEYADWLQALRNQSGVYVIRWAATGTILYVGESHTGRLAKTIKRHFYSWRDTAERKHHTYDAARIEVGIRMMPPSAAIGSQNQLILRMEPRDNGLIPAENKPF